MADLDFDPLFDPSMPENERVSRKVEQMPSSHKNSRLEQNRHHARKIRDAGFNAISKFIGFIGVIVCLAVVLAVAYFGWKAAGF